MDTENSTLFVNKNGINDFLIILLTFLNNMEIHHNWNIYIPDWYLEQDILTEIYYWIRKKWERKKKEKVIEEEKVWCQHKSDWQSYLSSPSQMKCILCWEFYN